MPEEVEVEGEEISLFLTVTIPKIDVLMVPIVRISVKNLLKEYEGVTVGMRTHDLPPAKK